MKQSKKPSFHSVPWFDAAEWKKVYELIYGPTSDKKCKKEALETLLVWRCRTSDLPAPIDSTLSLLQVDLHDSKDTNTSESDHLLRLLYSAAIIRFINLMLDESDKGLTMLQAASHLKLPRWIVNLRHEAAHGRDLPSLPSLKRATEISLNWLNTVYWVPQSETLKDFITNDHSVNELDLMFENKMSPLLSVYNTIAVLSLSTFKVSCIKDINDLEMKQDLIDGLIEVYSSKTHFEINEDTKLKTINKRNVSLVNKYLTNHQSVNKKQITVDLLTDELSFFMSSDVLSIDDDYTIAWQGLLTIFHRHNMIQTLLKKLISIVQDENECTKRRDLGALWIKHITFGLQKTLYIYKHLQKSSSTKSKKEQVSNLIEKHPKFKKGMKFNLQKPISDEIFNFSFLQEAITSYHPFLRQYAENLVSLMQPSLPTTTCSKILKLIKIANPVDNPKIEELDDKIYSVNDLINATNSSENLVMEEDSQDTNNPWKIASSEYNWKQCPIGILPWQI